MDPTATMPNVKCHLEKKKARSIWGSVFSGVMELHLLSLGFVRVVFINRR